MLLSLTDLKNLVSTLEGAKRDSPAEGQGAYCTAPNRDAQGNTERWEPKPRSRRPVGTAYPDGTKLEERNGIKGVRVPLGVHGRSFLAIDPDTKQVRCGACEAKL